MSESIDPQLSRRLFLQLASATTAGIAITRELPAQTADAESQFIIRFDQGAMVSLKRRADAFDTDYVAANRRLGDAVVRYRQGSGEWKTLQTAEFAARAVESAADSHSATYRTDELQLTIGFTVREATVDWALTLENLTSQPLEIGDLALPLPMNSSFQQQPTTAVLKHSLISGDGSFLFWMRRNSVGPYLTMLPKAGTRLEYWESQGGFRVFVHSAAAGALAKQGGTRWRQPNTSLTLAPRAKQAYGFALHWSQNYDAVRQLLFDQGLIDIHVVPGMTVPTDLSARFALRTKHRVNRIDAEFPKQTVIKTIGRNGDYQIFEVRFARLGENRLTIRYAEDRQLHLEFFSTEPIETLIQKRAAFIANHQHRDPAKWYNGLLAEWNMESHVLLGPDNYDRIKGWRIYEVSCDDPGLSKPAFLAAKNAVKPAQAEVSALDYYIEHFVWGGLQRTTEEEFAYGIYGIPDWKQNRESSDPGRNGRKHIWRIYDYPHITLMYFSMYRVARENPQIKTALTAQDYLRRAYGTAVAMFTIPYEIERWSAYQTGLYNELAMVDLIDALDREEMREQAERLRMHWERKVRAFIVDRPDLFRSEYAFDSTGFESTHALAKYALKHADRLGEQRPQNERMPAVPRASIDQFMQQQMDANLFCRGWLEATYYYLGSDYRGGGGDRYVLTYMSQMGGWSVLDYALHNARDPHPFIRLGYASYLSAWALMNTGTLESNYGYWYPGPENDGGAGGGFEPAPFGSTWLEQPHHRGSWYYSCEIDLGFCGALRGAATVIADDPIFGRFCYGGDWKKNGTTLEIIPRDGVRKRFHAVLGDRKLHIELQNDRFTANTAILVDESLDAVQFELESDNTAAHTTRIRVGGLPAGSYSLNGAGFTVAGSEAEVTLQVTGGRATGRLLRL